MSSQRRIQSSRANGAKSRGPITPEGRAISSHNNLVHGLTANTVLLRHESKEKFQALVDSYIVQFQPQTTTDLDLIEEMAVAKWRQRRIWGIEATTVDLEIDQKEAELNKKYAQVDHPMREAIAHRSLSDNSRVLAELSRYETRNRRAYVQARDRLEENRANFEVEPSPKNEHPESSQPELV